MRQCVIFALMFLGTLSNAQNIFTVAGISYTHRNAVDSRPALSAPLNSVYGLLIDKLTGRLLFNDEVLVLRLEPDETLLALAGTGPILTPQPQFAGTGAPASIPASFLNPRRFGAWRKMRLALYISPTRTASAFTVSRWMEP